MGKKSREKHERHETAYQEDTKKEENVSSPEKLGETLDNIERALTSTSTEAEKKEMMEKAAQEATKQYEEPEYHPSDRKPVDAAKDLPVREATPAEAQEVAAELRKAAPQLVRKPAAKAYILRVDFKRDDYFMNYLKSVIAYMFQPILLPILITISYVLNKPICFFEIKQKQLSKDEVIQRQEAAKKIAKHQGQTTERCAAMPPGGPRK